MNSLLRPWWRVLAGTIALIATQATGTRGDVVDDALAALPLCVLPHFTSEGWLSVAPSRFFVERWDAGALTALAEAAESPARTGKRDSRVLQIEHAGSLQAAYGFRRLAATLVEREVDSLSRVALSERAAAAFAERLEGAEELADCVTIKRGNRRPDLLLQPLRREAWRAVASVFADRSRLAWPPGPEEAKALEAGALTEAEMVELRALRLAVVLHERSFALLKDDLGGWVGNLSNQDFVCTDEASTVSFLIDRLSEAGLLEHFQRHPRFAARQPTTLAPLDHFAVMLESRRTGGVFVLDSWYEDGGLPPVIDRLERWQADADGLGDGLGLTTIGDPALDEALAGLRAVSLTADAVAALDARLEELAPGLPPPTPDGTATACGENGCVPGGDLEAAWGPVGEPALTASARDAAEAAPPAPIVQP